EGRFPTARALASELKTAIGMEDRPTDEMAAAKLLPLALPPETAPQSSLETAPAPSSVTHRKHHRIILALIALVIVAAGLAVLIPRLIQSPSASSAPVGV